MAKLDSKKIDAAIKRLTAAAKDAIGSLNDMTDGGYKDSALEKEPFQHVGFIATILQQASDQVKLMAKYDGMDDDQITEAQAAERETEKTALQQLAQAKLAKRQPLELVDDLAPELDADTTGTL